jgi:hypothetical protein
LRRYLYKHRVDIQRTLAPGHVQYCLHASGGHLHRSMHRNIQILSGNTACSIGNLFSQKPHFNIDRA